MYRFAEFTVSPARRVLLRDGDEQPLIPRYFDLLVLLIERRPEAVHRSEILDSVWSDVVVSDGALNQAVRTLRRVLGDDPRQPRFIRTVPRHGYRFVYAMVETEPDRPGCASDVAHRGSGGSAASGGRDPFERPLQRLLEPCSATGIDDLERLEAASLLHELATAEALRRLEQAGAPAAARAFLREARWDVPEAGPVPLLGRPGGLSAARVLIRLRLRRVLRLSGARWAGATVGAGVAGAVAGMLGGLALRFGPGSNAGDATPLLLALVGLGLGGAGAAGVGAGLALAETLFRSWRGLALVALGAAGGGAVGALCHALAELASSGLFGRDLSAVTGGYEGLVLGGAVGLGYHLGTRRIVEGLAAPRGRGRLAVALLAGACCGTAAVVLAATGSYLGAASLDLLARTFPGSHVGLGPLARLLGEAVPGPRTTAVIAAWEGGLFGLGSIAGFTRRPRARPDLREGAPELTA
jgi:DNA-binding winged helix-turn-helix (wHTH) protein